MPTAAKAEKIDELERNLRESEGAVILDYRGLNVAAISALRRQLSEQEIEFQVAKNTLLRIAADRAGVDVDPSLLMGPTAVAFGRRDPVAPAKVLTDFARRNRVVSVKGGILAGRSIGAEEVGRVAELPSREILLAQLVGVIAAPLSKALGVLQAPAREVAGLALALHDKQAGSEAA